MTMKQELQSLKLLSRSESLMSSPGPVKSADEIIVFAISHPIRVEALRIFNEREASVAELAREIRQDAKKVGNHVKALSDYGCIEWTRSQKKRGAEEHFYRGSRRIGIPSDEWERLGPEERSWVSTLDLLAAFVEGLAAIRTGRFDMRLDRHLSLHTAEVDEQAWSELTAVLEETARRIAQIKDAAADRRGLEAGTGFPVIAALLGAGREVSPKDSAISRLSLPHSEE